MEGFTWIIFAILISYSSYPKKVKKLESKLKRLERKMSGGTTKMSKILSELINQKCKIKKSDLAFEIECTILDVDDEWVKYSYSPTKNELKTTIIRIDAIENIDLIDDTFIK